MEALVAVGLASNIVSFIDFGSKLIRTASELRDSAASADNEAHAVVITHFEKLAEQMSNSAQGISNASTSPSPLEQSLIPLANGCCHLAKKLLQRLDDLSILSSQKDSRLRRTKTAIKCLWTQREVNETANQLHHFRSEICLHLVHQVRQSQETLQGYQASKDDVQHLLAKVEALQTPIEDMRLGLHEKLDNHHSEILNSVNQSETKSLEYKNDITNAIVSSTREIQDSQVSLIQDLTRQIKNQHSITGDSIGQVRVENSAFYAQAMEVIRPGNHPSSSLLSPLMGFLEEYQHTLLATAKKELQGSVELELKKIQETVFQAAYEAQTRNKEYHHEPNNTQNSGSCSKEYDDTGKLYAEKSRQTEREYTCGERRPRRKRSDISLIYANRWTVETSFGMLILSIQEIAVFDSNRLEYSVYEIAAQLNPFPQWLSTGCSITYRKTTDAQRNSDFNFRPKIYRVLSRDHRVWEAILGDDVESVRTRLAQKVVGPSDCTEDGMTILHVAVLCGKLEICKTLVASGADINARDSWGVSPIDYAILPLSLCGNAQGLEIFHFLQGLPRVDMEGLWLDIRVALLATISLTMLAASTLTVLGDNVKTWLTTCRSVDFGFDNPESHNFLSACVLGFGTFIQGNARRRELSGIDITLSPKQQDTSFLSRMVDLFPCQVNTFFALILAHLEGKGGNVDSTIPVGRTARLIVHQLRRARQHSLIRKVSADTLTYHFHGYFVDRRYYQSLKFWEYVISIGIKKRLDCIFDSDEGRTIYDWFKLYHWESVWEDILRDHGIDPEWAYAENERRKRVKTGKTTAHEVHVAVDSSQTRNLTKRRGYVEAEG